MVLPFEQVLKQLPPIAPQSLLARIADHNSRHPKSIVVLDDDPTGTQTVHGIGVLTRWDLPTIIAEFERNTGLFYILTNSRALPEHQAVRLAREIGENILEASRRTNRAFEVISRSDSTLRGHYPAEVDALTEALGARRILNVIIPFFEEGGRYTINDTHYVKEGDRLIPAAETPFAADPVFGYTNSNLKKWVEEKTEGRIPAASVSSISIDDIRIGGPDRVAAILNESAGGGASIVNAADYRDLEVVTAALQKVCEQDVRFLCRTAASFVRSRAALVPRDLLTAEELVGSRRTGGLIVVGSHVPKSTSQLADLLENTDVIGIEVDVEHIVDSAGEADTYAIVDSADSALEAGRDVVVYTSRKLIAGADNDESLQIAANISQALVDIVGSLKVEPRYLLAKGGITSSDIATGALGLIRAEVLGQILPGVPVWRAGPESKFPDLAYIVFPGNVGADDAVTTTVRKLGAL